MSLLEPANDQHKSLIASVLERLKSSQPTPALPAPSASDATQLIDHTLLALDATSEQITKLCEEASTFNFRTVCVRPKYVPLARELLRNRNVEIACVIGFPEGTQETSKKVTEALKAIEDGASELDMVLNYEALKAEHFDAVYDDVKAVREAAPRTATTHLKVILETSQLSKDQIVAGCALCCKAGVDFVKTSTGFRGRGASVEDVKLMRAACDVATSIVGGERVKIKASGGIRTGPDLVGMAQAGAERIGASAGVKILESLKEPGHSDASTKPVTEGVY
ncbi:MAG: hypothetical protein Q9160_007215 [Pyrenula sp. 1 TL-2023]